jgi:hypothetical protein
MKSKSLLLSISALLGATVIGVAATSAVAADPTAAPATTQAPTAAQSAAPTASDVVAALVKRSNAIAGYHANITVDLQMHSFPFLATTLDGTASYQRPGKYTVNFNSVPELASAFQNVSGDIGDPAAWDQKYVVTLDPSTRSAPTNTVVLRLVQRTKGQIDHELAYVDTSNATVTNMDWFYYSGGKITMSQHFSPIDGVLLVDTQNAEFDMPGYKASADAHFNGYSVQVSMTAPHINAH